MTTPITPAECRELAEREGVMTDADRKMLTEYLGECWDHDFEWIKISNSYGWDRCKKCGFEIHDESQQEYNDHNEYRRPFDTPADLHAVYSKLVDDHKEEIGPYTLWDSFYDYAMDRYNEEFNPVECIADTCHFTAWLFCLSGEGYEERAEMVAEYLRTYDGP